MMFDRIKNLADRGREWMEVRGLGSDAAKAPETLGDIRKRIDAETSTLHQEFLDAQRAVLIDDRDANALCASQGNPQPELRMLDAGYHHEEVDKGGQRQVVYTKQDVDRDRLAYVTVRDNGKAIWSDSYPSFVEQDIAAVATERWKTQIPVDAVNPRVWREVARAGGTVDVADADFEARRDWGMASGHIDPRTRNEWREIRLAEVGRDDTDYLEKGYEYKKNRGTGQETYAKIGEMPIMAYGGTVEQQESWARRGGPKVDASARWEERRAKSDKGYDPGLVERGYIAEKKITARGEEMQYRKDGEDVSIKVGEDHVAIRGDAAMADGVRLAIEKFGPEMHTSSMNPELLREIAAQGGTLDSYDSPEQGELWKSIVAERNVSVEVGARTPATHEVEHERANEHVPPSIAPRAEIAARDTGDVVIPNAVDERRAVVSVKDETKTDREIENQHGRTDAERPRQTGDGNVIVRVREPKPKAAPSKDGFDHDR